nr:uncharacterized protein LOC108122021 isoform X1 [Drosophila bipectinata]
MTKREHQCIHWLEQDCVMARPAPAFASKLQLTTLINRVMNFYVLYWLMFFLAPGGCPIYSIDLSTLEVQSSDFQNELTLQSMLNSELRQYRNGLNKRLTEMPVSFNQHTDPSASRKHPFETDMDLEHAEWLLDTQQLTSGDRCAKESDSDFLGTNLFNGPEKHCFSTEDIALMSARRDFELLVPKSFPNLCMVSDNVVAMLVKYFNTVNQIVKKMSDIETRRVLQRAFYDALGGYLRFYLVPAAQMSFYAGHLKLNTVDRLVKLYRQCRMALNTNGNGWRSPSKELVNQFLAAKVEPMKMPKYSRCEDDASSCAFLDQTLIQVADQGQMIVPVPSLEPMDEDGYLTNICLPFRKKRIYNLRAPSSAFIVMRFFEALTNCHRFQGVNQVEYNRKLLTWIHENLQLHYADGQFYPGLGGILQIEATILSQKEQEEPEVECTTETEDHAKEPETKEAEMDTSPSEDSRKLSRSAKHWRMEEKREQEQGDRYHTQEYRSGIKGEEESFATTLEAEECRECDNDETLIWCIAAFLAVLLLLILFIICCCMRKGRKKKPVDEEAAQEKPKKKKEEYHEEKPPEEPKPKEKRRERSYYSVSSRLSGKSHSGDPNGPQTSSSSMACQFDRKCLPLPCLTAKGDAATKVVPSFMSTDSSPRSMLRSPLRQSPVRSPLMSTHSEYLSNSDSDAMPRERERKVERVHGVDSRQQLGRKDLKKTRNREKSGSSEDRKMEDSSPERRRPSRVRIAETDDSAEDRNPVRKPSRQKAKPKEDKTRLRGGSNPDKDSPSWETMYGDS